MADLLHKGHGIGAIHNACASKREGTRQNLVDGRSILQAIDIRPITSAFCTVPYRDKAPFEQLIFH